MPSRIRGLALAALGLLAATALAIPARAEPLKCQRTIAKAASQYVQARAKILAKCEIVRVAGKVPLATDCPNDPSVAAALAKIVGKLELAVHKACGGADKICGGGDDDTAAAIGWGTICPNFEGGSCTDAVGPGCEGIATCLLCIHDEAVDQSLALYAGAFDVESPPTDKVLNKCQQTIVKASHAYLVTRAKILQKCWDARLLSKHGNACPVPGDGKAAAALAKAELKKVTAICKACGGADKVCGGGDDLTPAAIGFVPACSPVTVPGGAACAAPIATLDDLVACVDCVTDFKTACADRAQVPQFGALPAECNAAQPTPTPTVTPCTVPTPTPGPCPGSVELTLDGPSTDLDNGWTGIAHEYNVPTNGRLTLAVSGCSGGSWPTCGECTTSGPIPNAGGPAFANRRCAGEGSWVQCTADADCTLAGVAGPCVYFFGAPLPIAAGGVPVCVTNELNGPISGTINAEDGTSEALVTLTTRAFTGTTVAEPCPLCESGTCTDGPRAGNPCVVNGVSGYFNGAPLSLDCPPAAGTSVGNLPITLNVATGLQTAALSAGSPDCTGPGYTSYKCLCDTCNNAVAEPCATDADCPMSGGNPGVCGGRRCLGGANVGEPCVVNGDCPGGQCGLSGLATAPNGCTDVVCARVAGEEGSIDEGRCAAGPFDTACSLERFRSCSSDADCNPPGCADCLSGQTCLTFLRPCFTDNGYVGTRCYGGGNDPGVDLCTTLADCPDQGAGTFCGGGDIRVEGTPDPVCGDTAVPRLGTVFCVPPTTSSASNAAGGLPGPGRLSANAVLVFGP